jgi:hypothetical protein
MFVHQNIWRETLAYVCSSEHSVGNTGACLFIRTFGRETLAYVCSSEHSVVNTDACLFIRTFGGKHWDMFVLQNILWEIMAFHRTGKFLKTDMFYLFSKI